jgi:hypothetical protein
MQNIREEGVKIFPKLTPVRAVKEDEFVVWNFVNV